MNDPLVFRFCPLCERYVSSLNKHCAKCNLCPSKVQNSCDCILFLNWKGTASSFRWIFACHNLYFLCLQDGREWKHCSTCVKCVKPCRSINHRCKLMCSYWFHVTLPIYFLWIYLNIFPVSLGALPVLWPLCPARPPMYHPWREGGLL